MLWHKLGHTEAVIDAPWPVVDENALTRDSLEIVVQVNGKVRAKIEVGVDESRDSVERKALDNDKVQRFIDGKTIAKVIVVPGKLVNVVAK